MPGARPLPPIIFVAREARHVADLIVGRLATMTTVDREDEMTAIELRAALKKVNEAIASTTVVKQQYK